MKTTSEAAFESVIESHLLAHGYVATSRDGYDRELAIFPDTVLSFIRDTQPKEWGKLEAILGEKTGEQILADLCKWMDVNGSLATLRHGFKCYGRPLYVAFFKAAHELNAELEARYAANRLGITRQLRYRRKEDAKEPAEETRRRGIIDITLSLNGIPIATIELKNAFTGQRVENACGQYRHQRDHREPIFAFKRRTLVHFAADTEAVMMTTRLAGPPTHFFRSTRGMTAPRAIRLTRRGEATERRICGKRFCSATACSIFSPVFSICRPTRNATIREGSTRPSQ